LISISEAAALFLSEPAPCLLLDTCALLDVIRAPQREDDPNLAVKAALELANRGGAPRKLWIVASGIIKTEWEDNVVEVTRSLRDHIKQVDRSVRKLNVTLQALPSAALPISKGKGELSSVSADNSGFESLKVAERLNGLVEALLVHAVWLDPDAEVLLAAHRRSASNLKPASKGKREGPDCLIIETYFALCRMLRARAFSNKCVFVSANKKDFCAMGDPMTIHADMAATFSECQIDFAVNLSHASWIFDQV
jgi:hypothetical protein